MDPERYVTRIGLDPGALEGRSLETLGRLQRAHITSVPFENLAIVGDPRVDREADGVILERAAIYEKVVDGGRGGFCYELNGLCNWLLGELGYDVDRVVGAVLQDGEPLPPANHLTSIVHLDRSYVVDVGLGVPPMRRPTPLDGTSRRDETGVAWRIVESDRPDADYLTQYRVGDDPWADRYVFRTEPRELSYVEPTCAYLTAAPESPFTGDPVVARATDEGYLKLSGETLTRFADGTESTRSVDPAERATLLTDEFGLPVPE